MSIRFQHAGTFISVAATSLLLTACATAPKAPEGAADARSRLMQLQGDANLASRAPIEIKDADAAVTAAEKPQRDATLGRHLVLMADHKVDIAGAWAQSRWYEDQRADLTAQSDAARLASRTREADLARNDAAVARNQSQVARNDATLARNQTQAARDDASVARSQTELARTDAAVARNETEQALVGVAAVNAENADLQRSIAELNARDTDRGLVVTLGDVLFETGKAELRGGTPVDLDNLAVFLNRYPTRTVLIEGHTDNVGTDSSNLSLSQRRATSVQTYLVIQGISSARLTASGQGETHPIASNDDDTGRQQNRRVEVIISNDKPN
jgi:outer membrane protein OmpA-like peptidoglycan-associated protein